MCSFALKVRFGDDSADVNVNANAKQLLRLLDSLKVLGDESAALLEQGEDANKARLEAEAAREEMKRFELEYNKRFHTLKLALENYVNSSYSNISSNTKKTSHKTNLTQCLHRSI